jgi:HAD superfamily phosphatase (TIGR01668 family)
MSPCGEFVDKSVNNEENTRPTGGFLRPDRTAKRLADISLAELKAEGVRAIILDLDNTTLGYGRDDISAEVKAWTAQALEMGFSLVLLSNNFTQRARRVSAELGIAAIAGALKPLPHGFARARALMGTTKAQTIVVGDQFFTDVLGARLSGLRVILTEPIESHDWLGTRVLRFLERAALGRRS